MTRLTLTDGTIREMSEEEYMHADLMDVCNNKAIINVEFFEEDGK